MRILLGVVTWLFGVGAGFAQALPDEVLQLVQKNPERYVDRAAALIYGYGGDQGIDKAGVARAIALQRADARAAALRKLIAADLNFDGAIDRDEMEQVAAVASASARGKLWKMQQTADADGDGSVAAAELEAFGRAEALRKITAADEAAALSVLNFDADKNGWVDLDEVTQAVAELSPSPGN